MSLFQPLCQRTGKIMCSMLLILVLALVFEAHALKLESGPPPLTPSDIVCVSAYFPNPQYSQSQRQYDAWIRAMISILNCRFVLFTVPEKESYFTGLFQESAFFERLQSDPNSITYFRTRSEYESMLLDGLIDTPLVIVTCFHSAFEIPVILPFVTDMKLRQPNLDPESHRRIPELYAIWNSKPWMLDQASRMFIEPAQLYFWLDIGNYRYSKLVLASHFPDPGKMSVLTGGRGNTILGDRWINLLTNAPSHFFPAYSRINVLRNPNLEATLFSFAYSTKDVSAGAFFGGSGISVRQYAIRYYKKLADWHQRGFFYGKDQNLLNAVNMENPELVMALDVSYFPGDFSPLKGYQSIYWYLGTHRSNSKPSKADALNVHLNPLKPFSSYFPNGRVSFGPKINIKAASQR